MTELCQICETEPFKYKCPSCLKKYCSLSCFKEHRLKPCGPEVPTVLESSKAETANKYQFSTEDTVPVEKLQLLESSEEVKVCLSNPHLRDLLTSLVGSENTEGSMDKAMQEPLFLELVNACLNVVEPESSEH
nr:EOG090X0JQ4 [Cyclestheria hislopi]